MTCATGVPFDDVHNFNDKQFKENAPEFFTEYVKNLLHNKNNEIPFDDAP